MHKAVALSVTIFAALTGCATAPEPPRFSEASSRDVCLRVAALQGGTSEFGNAMRDYRAHGLNDAKCHALTTRPIAPTQPMLTQEERDARTLRALEILNAGFNRPAPAQAPATAFLRNSYVSGMNRICVYDRLGSQYVMTIQAAQMCPLSQ